MSRSNHPSSTTQQSVMVIDDFISSLKVLFITVNSAITSRLSLTLDKGTTTHTGLCFLSNFSRFRSIYFYFIVLIDFQSFFSSVVITTSNWLVDLFYVCQHDGVYIDGSSQHT